ncbi:zf-HC2 domain-containing protein [Ideonella sp. YS5]|uniref:zf-HC2 domain-containing protein n=1 Tax=Ideonella sp. YS5 TaxID=3453714 RepID=UPI003EEA49F7
MSWKIDCREATHLVLQGEDQPLSWADRLRLRMHLAICVACPRFVRQVALMRQAIGGWRAYKDGDEDPPG